MNLHQCLISRSGTAREQKNKDRFVMSSVTHHLKWLIGLSNAAALLFKG